MFIELKLALCK